MTLPKIPCNVSNNYALCWGRDWLSCRSLTCSYQNSVHLSLNYNLLISYLKQLIPQTSAAWFMASVRKRLISNQYIILKSTQTVLKNENLTQIKVIVQF